MQSSNGSGGGYQVPPQSELTELVQQVLSEATSQGASAAEAGVSFDRGLSLTVRLGEVETLEFNRDRGLGVTVYFGQTKGSASTSDWSPVAIRDTVSAACNIARYTQDDPCAGLAPKERMAHEIVSLDLCHPWNIDAEQATELARTGEEKARSYDKRISNSEGFTVNTQQAMTVYANSHGFVGGYPTSRHSLSCSILAQLDQEMERDYWYTIHRDAAALESPQQVGQKAAERAVKRLGARRLKTQQTPVIFSAEVATGFIGHFIAAIRGGKLYRKASFLLDQLGQPIFPDWMNISERPHIPQALGSAPFDSEGVQTQARSVVQDGILQGYVLDSYSGCKLGMETTGNAGGVHNLTVQPGASNQQQLLEQMGTGLLVTEVMGQGVNYITGDYSRGAAGYWVENGQIQFPVHEITIAGNLKNMFKDLVSIGNDVDLRGNIRCGSALLEKMTIAGE